MEDPLPPALEDPLPLVEVIFQKKKSKGMFGWGENKEDGKEEEENRVENGIFSYLVQERKQER